MIDLHVLFERNKEASVLFDYTTAIRMRMPAGLDPLNPSLDIHQVIRQLQVLREQALEFVGQAPGRLTVYRRPDLPSQVSERLEAAAFAAGIEEFATVGLGEIARTFFPYFQGSRLLLHAAQDSISGIVLSRDIHGTMAAIREATEPLDETSLRERFVSAVERGLAPPSARRQAAVHELIEIYWATHSPLELEVREWGLGGWSAVSLSGADAAAIDDITSQALRKLLAKLVANTKEAEISVIGDGRPRVSSLLGALMPDAHIVPFPAASLLDAMITLGRTGRCLRPDRGAEECRLETHLLFDPRTDLGNTVGLKRDNTAVRVFLEPGKRIQLDHIPAKWHRAGFDIEVMLEGRSERMRLFKGHVSMDLRTFSARIASRWSSSSGLLIRIAIPELDTSVMLVAQAGREPAVAHYRARLIESVG